MFLRTSLRTLIVTHNNLKIATIFQKKYFLKDFLEIWVCHQFLKYNGRQERKYPDMFTNSNLIIGRLHFLIYLGLILMEAWYLLGGCLSRSPQLRGKRLLKQGAAHQSQIFVDKVKGRCRPMAICRFGTVLLLTKSV